jgi:GntR family transcriptional regulator, carbon starvation induced regulator
MIRKSRSEHAWEALRSAILSGRLRPGSPLRFQELQAICGMSVSPVREALARLVAAGLVEGEHNRGYRVTCLTRTDLDDLVRMRIKLETWALERSIEYGDEHWEASVISAFHLLERRPRKQLDEPRLHDAEWEARHAAFHFALISACDSPILMQSCRDLFDRADRYRTFSLTGEVGSRDVLEEHRAIMDAAISRDADRAKSLLALHYESTAELVRSRLAREAEPQALIDSSRNNYLFIQDEPNNE